MQVYSVLERVQELRTLPNTLLMLSCNINVKLTHAWSFSEMLQAPSTAVQSPSSRPQSPGKSAQS